MRKTVITILAILFASSLLLYGAAAEPALTATTAASAPATAPATIVSESLVYKKADGRGLKLFIEKPADWKATDHIAAYNFRQQKRKQPFCERCGRFFQPTFRK